MKKSLFIAALAAVVLMACNNKAGESHEHNADGSHPTESTHAHDDGSIHDDHDADTSIRQEEFKVNQDSTAHNPDHSDADHKH